MADELTHLTEPDPVEEALAVVRAQPELREAEFMRLFLCGPKRTRFNQLASARGAGYGTPNSSDESLRVISSRLLHAPRNVLRVRRALDRVQEASDRQIEELSRIAFAKITDFVTWDNTGITVRSSNDLDEDQISAVCTVVEHRAKDGHVESVEVQLADKLRAQELLARLRKLIGPDPSLAEGASFTFTINVNDRSQQVHLHQNGGPANGDGPIAPSTNGEGAQS